MNEADEARIKKIEQDLADCRAALGNTIRALVGTYQLARVIPAIYSNPDHGGDQYEKDFDNYKEFAALYRESIREAMDQLWGPEDAK